MFQHGSDLTLFHNAPQIHHHHPAAEMLDYIRKQHKLLIGAEVFDVFQGDALAAGKKSLAFRLTFQDMNKTLTDKKVNAIIAKLIKGIEDTFHGEVR